MDNQDKGSLTTKFLKVFTLSVIVFALIIGAATAAYTMMNKKNKEATATTGDNLNKPTTGKDKDGKTTTGDDKPSQPVKQMTNFLIMGVDADGYRTDVVMITSLNHVTGEVNIMSIPRDTAMTLPTDMYNDMRSRGKKVGKEIAINVVPSHSIVAERNANSVRVLEENFDIDIDYYVKMNLSAFRKVIDIIGPIRFNVEFEMTYKDPVQDFYVNIKPGLQDFNGHKAEQLIRWRKYNDGSGYTDGDIGRIRMQHDFLKEIVKQVLTGTDKIDFLRIGTVVLNTVETDFDKLMDYLPIIQMLSPDKIAFHSAEGEWNSKKKLYEIKKDKIKEYFSDVTTVVEEVKPEPVTETETGDKEPEKEPQTTPDSVSSKDMSIQILNGTGINGLAGRTKKKLESEGYTVPTVGDYDKRPKKTMIIIPNEGMGEDLATYFNQPDIKLQPENLPSGVDIQIIIGLDDKTAY